MSETLEAIRVVGLPALFGGLVLALVCGALSVQVVLNRVVLLALTLGQICAVGVAFTVYQGHHTHTLAAVLTSTLAVLVLGNKEESARTSSEAWLGVLYAAGAALSLLLVAKSAVGKEEVVHLLEGDLLYMRPADVGFLAAGGLALLVALAAGFRHFLLVGFDPEGAAAMGYRVARWRVGLLGLVALAVAAGMESGGLLMTFALLVIPGAAALRLSTDVVRASVLAACLGAAAHVVGLGLSFVPAIDLPSAPLAVVVLAGLFACTVPIRRA